MTHFNSTRTTQRVFERFTSGVAALGLTALAFVASNAHAAAPTQAHSIALRYTQADVSSPEGAAKLYSSIKSAARQVCGVHAGRLSVSEFERAQRCYEQTLDDVVGEVNLPLLTQVHKSAGNKVG